MSHSGMLGQTLIGALAVDMGLQWVGWGISSYLQTEKYYDLFGSLTFITLALGSLVHNGSYAPRQLIVTGMVCAWAMRLGTYLVLRIRRDKEDKRFDDAKKNPGKFFVFWTMQGAWVWLTSLPMLMVNAQVSGGPLTWVHGLGLGVWLLGFVVESAADYQKWVFRSDPKNKGDFIQSGLWKHSRHPNYFGEIVMWWAVFGVAASSLSGVQLAAGLASPAFVMTLLLYVSGIPLLEAAADKKWGENPKYQEYKANTRDLIPLPKTLF